MAKKLYVAFLWHMHQPLYKDSLAGRYYLPWVRLHALKGYYDMPAILERFPKMRSCFNLTPSLLYQINDYLTNLDTTDDFLEISLKPSKELIPENKEFILSNFFMNNWNTVIKPNLRYSELLHKRGKIFSKEELAKKIEIFSEGDFRDLQVLFNLGWFGYSLRKKEPLIEELFKKSKDYAEEDKKNIMELQRKALGEIIPLYKRPAAAKQIELTTSPFYHPILPLLYNGGRGKGYNWETDARYQIEKGVSYFKEVFESTPRGMWPSEGSVSTSIVKPIADAGIRWIATDEDILLKSVGGGNRDELVYKPYRITQGNSSLNIVFRDKKLSDLIGFVYYNTSAVLAAEDFMRQLHSIRHRTESQEGEHLVTVILDGENPWENYRDGGEEFLSELYTRLINDEKIEPITFSEYLDRFPPNKTLGSLYAGSWINHNFNIWYGHEEDKRAWKMIDQTRRFLEKTDIDEEKKKKAREEIYIAEGSDWFWWYGDDFSSQSEETFDFLFRNHLMNVYRLAGKRIPTKLKQAIKHFGKSVQAQESPVQFVHPVLDGMVTNFYEWVNAGSFTVEEPMGAMRRSERLVHKIYYGFDLANLYLRVDFYSDVDREDLKMLRGIFYLVSGKEFQVEFVLDEPKIIELFELRGESKVKLEEISDSICFKQILEIKIPFSKINAKPNQEIHFNFMLLSSTGIRLDECPYKGILTLTAPDDRFEAFMWSV